MALKISTHNVIGFNAKAGQLIEFFKNKRFDIIICTETKPITPQTENLIKRNWPGSYQINHAQTFGDGLLVLYSNKITQTYIVDIENIIQGRLSVLNFKNKENSFQFHIFAVYLPSFSTFNNRTKMENYMKTLNQTMHMDKYTQNKILIGDFNFTENPKLDRSNQNMTPTEKIYMPIFKEIKEQNKITDCFREFNPNKIQYTFQSKSSNIQSRIDRCYISDTLKRFYNKTEIKPGYWSDHDVLTVTLNIPTGSNRGKGTWKLNTSILNDPHLVNQINNYINNFAQTKYSFDNLQIWWEIAKIEIKKICIKYSIWKSKQRTKERNNIETNLSDLKEIPFNQRSENQNQQITFLEENLKNLDNYKYEGIKIRSRVDQIEKDEQYTPFFFNQYKTHEAKKEITQLYNKDGQTCTDIKDLKNIVHNFYQELYTPNPVSEQDQNILLDQITNTLDNESQQEMEGLLTEKEIFLALKGMKNNKSPGSDGLPREFYLKFWNTLKPHLLEVLNEIFTIENLSKTQNLAIITLLYKKNDHKN